ncbi:hypothetical protein ACSMFQ_25635 [Ectopseudomonas chengduensis]
MKKIQQSRSLTGALQGFRRPATEVGNFLVDVLGHSLFKALGEMGGEWHRGIQPELLGKGLASTGWVNGDAGSWEQQAHGIEHGLERTNDKGQGQIAGEFDM